MKNYVVIGGIVQFLTVVNVAYAASLSYKESLTNGSGIKKTSNGILLAIFFLCAKIGQGMYRIIRFMSGSKKAVERKDKIFAGVISALLTYGLALFLYLLYSALCVSVPEGESISTYITMTAKSTFQTVLYYGFIFGLFGGDNCRLVTTFIGKAAGAITNKFNQIDDVRYVENAKDAIEIAKEEIADRKAGGTGIKINPAKYIISCITKTLTTVLENVRGLTSVLVDVANIEGFITLALAVFGFRFIYWFASKGEVSSELRLDFDHPMSVLVGNITSMITTIVIICLIKLIIMLIMSVMPESISNVWYAFNGKLYNGSMDSLNQMAERNLEQDTYARECSMRDAVKGTSGRRFKK